jgi:subtilisin family serine protease
VKAARSLISLVATLVAVLALAAPAGAADYVVVLADGTNAASHAASHGVQPTHVYTNVIDGYSADLTNAEAASLANAAGVESVQRSNTFQSGASDSFTALSPKSLDAKKGGGGQIVSVSMKRVGAHLSATADIDGIDERVDIDVAVLDGGVDPTHPDLNVVGGTSCLPKDPSFVDRDGHGTGVAGAIGAIDNTSGVVGIAPGARIWAVKVADKKGFITDAALLCGLDWLVATNNDIEVANLSLSGPANYVNDCASDPDDWDALLTATCAVIADGTTVVAAAGNDAVDAIGETPAAFPDVIAVSAFADTDGIAGGLGPTSGERGCGVDIADDTFAYFSNFGSVVDISAPGVCVGTTALRGGTAGATGTSFSAPIVAGAAALILANHPKWSPDQVRSKIIATRENVAIAGDTDGFNEGIVNVSTL